MLLLLLFVTCAKKANTVTSLKNQSLVSDASVQNMKDTATPRIVQLGSGLIILAEFFLRNILKSTLTKPSGRKYKTANVNGRCATTDPSSRKQKDEEGVKVLHTKSQAGRTQKSGPPATRLECHPLRRTVKLHTACGKTETKKGEEQEEEKRQKTTTRC